MAFPARLPIPEAVLRIAQELEAAKANVQGLAQLSAERVRDEWFKGIATAKRVSKLLGLWLDVGAARIWLPEIREDRKSVV